MTAGREAEILRRLDRLEGLLLQVLQQQAQTTTAAPTTSMPLEAEIQAALMQGRDIGAYFRERGRALPRQPRRNPKTRREP